MCDRDSVSMMTEDALITAGQELRSARERAAAAEAGEPSDEGSSAARQQWADEREAARQRLSEATQVMAAARQRNATAIQEKMSSVEDALAVHKAFMIKPVASSSTGAVTSVTQITPVDASPGGATITPPRSKQPSAIPEPSPVALPLDTSNGTEQTTDKPPTDPTPQEIIDLQDTSTLVTREQMTEMQARGLPLW